LESKSRAEIINYILKGNAMMRRHAEERHGLLKQIIDHVNTVGEEKTDLVNMALSEAANLQEEIENLETQILDKSEMNEQLYFKLMHLNKMMRILDKKDERRSSLISEIMQYDANLLARDELIEILQEYIDMETASSHRLVAELSEAQTSIEEYNLQLDTYEKLSRHDPRFKALEILNDHPQGMSMTQLSFMLGTSQYEAQKVIQELIQFGMIGKRSGDLIHSSTNVDAGLSMDEISPQIANTNP
jgi:hypothetical protein